MGEKTPSQMDLAGTGVLYKWVVGLDGFDGMGYLWAGVGKEHLTAVLMNTP